MVFTNFTDDELVGVPLQWKPLYRRIWDVTDYVVPPTENNAFFVTTNVIITPNQTQGECPEDPSIPGAKCDPVSNNTCAAGTSHTLGHGLGCSFPVKSRFVYAISANIFGKEDEVGEDNGRNKAPKKQLVSTIADSTRNAPCRPSPLINLRVTSDAAIRERTTLKIIANRFI